MKRFKTFQELGLLIPLNYGQETFNVSQEEKEHYISLLTEPAQEYIKRTGNPPLFRGVKLIVNAN